MVYHARELSLLKDQQLHYIRLDSCWMIWMDTFDSISIPVMLMLVVMLMMTTKRTVRHEFVSDEKTNSFVPVPLCC